MRQHMRVPSYRRLMALLGWRSTNAVATTFEALERKGHIRREQGRVELAEPADGYVMLDHRGWLCTRCGATQIIKVAMAGEHRRSMERFLDDHGGCVDQTRGSL